MIAPFFERRNLFRAVFGAARSALAAIRASSAGAIRLGAFGLLLAGSVLLGLDWPGLTWLGSFSNRLARVARRM